MKTLSDLSNELLGLVLEDVHPLDLEAFFATSKGHRQRGAWLLERHHLLKRTYSTFTYHKDIRRGAPARLLKAIWNNPRIADYILKVDIEGWDLTFHGEGTSEAKLTRPPYTMEDLSLYENALKECKYVDGTELHEYLSILSKGDEEPIIVLLLLSLPNLEHLRFVSAGILDGADIIRCIIEELPTQALTRLTTAHLQASSNGPDSGYDDFEVMVHLCSLPSMKEISFHGFASDPREFEEFHESDTYCNIPVGNMTFSRCAIVSKELFGFLSRCDNLTTFSYSPGPEGHNTESYSPFWIRAALQTHCKDTLKCLTILSKDQPQSFMGSLKAFKTLEDVTTDLKLLIGRLDETVRTLSEMLPSSIRRVNLYIAEDLEEQALQELAQEMKMEDTPELEHTHFIRPDEGIFSVCTRAREGCPED